MTEIFLEQERPRGPNVVGPMALPSQLALKDTILCIKYLTVWANSLMFQGGQANTSFSI